MKSQRIAVAVERLSHLVRVLSCAGVVDREDYRKWLAEPEHQKSLANLLHYPQGRGYPSVASLVMPHFHPRLPLIGWNYTPVAHNTLHAHPEGWTDPIRLCRGIVYDFCTADLIALPFYKFFNRGEHPETQRLPHHGFTGTVKHDGHLGIVFHYARRWRLTSRGDFTSRTSMLGTRMLRNHLRLHPWNPRALRGITPLVEIIHPTETRVYRVYRQPRLILIGAGMLTDEGPMFADDRRLRHLGKQLHLPVTERWHGDDLEDVRREMRDRRVKNREGLVLHYPETGLYVKFKYETHVGKMVADKLSYGYLMRRIKAGNVDKMITLLPEEIYERALAMRDEIRHAMRAHSPERRRERLLELVPPEERTSAFRSAIRELIKP